MHYDAKSRRLYWRDNNGLFVAVQFSIPQRIRMHVRSPSWRNRKLVEKIIKPIEIHKHRMEVEPDEVLMPMLSSREVDSKAMRRSLAMTYHPDRYSIYDQLLKDIVNSRMQEVNAATDKLHKAKRR